ncbi:O-antigen ligase family protein [Patescibacteria group bacterium]|nr:O-antigen ligase family protein [Patescibacteria group bacterium]
MEKFLKYLIWTGLIGICSIPLIVNGNYYFPYITFKTLAFKIAVEVLFLAYLALAVKKPEYRPKLNFVLLLFISYLAVVFISSLSAGTFYSSFWSNNERSEGLLLLLHLLLYLIVLSGFIRGTKQWLVILEASFLSSIFVSFLALGQYFKLNWIIDSAGGSRLTATIGNAGYVAGYLIFNIFFGLLLFFLRDNKYLKIYYLLGIILQIFVALYTSTRGAIISLTISLFIFTIYLAFYRYKEKKIIRNTSIIVFFLLSILIISIFANKEADWVRKNDVFERISSISLEATTAQNRLYTWESAWKGFKEKPILGYGYENFYQVFDRYFNPKIYRKAGSVVWFDRAHNIVFDRLITGGIVGLFLYLLMLFLPLWYLWKHFKKNKDESVGYIIPMVLSLTMVSYFIQNLFIFEALVTYIPLFIVLGFLSQYSPSYADKLMQSKKIYLTLLIIFSISFIPMLFTFNIKPAMANKGFIQGLIKSKTATYKDAYNQLIDVIEMDTHGNQEYRQHLGELVAGAVDSSVIDQDWLKNAIFRAEQEFDKQIAEKPTSARNYLMFMRFLNKTYIFNVERLVKSLKLGEKALELSPTRPQVYYETGYSQVYLGKYYQSINKENEAKKLFDQSVLNMQKAIDLQERVVESYLNMAMVLFVVDRGDKVQGYLDKMDELGVDYHTEESLVRMANSAVHKAEFEWTKRFYQEIVQINPDKPENWVNLALSYAYLGENQKAVEIAGKVAEFGGEYKEQSKNFIEDILKGTYKK